jgi:hypothetical protein
MVRVDAQDFQGRRCGQDTGPLRWEAEDASIIGG